MTASEAGLRRGRFLNDLRPLLGQLSPFLRQVNPILYGLGQYQKEVNAFFSNTVAATEATDKPPKAAGTVRYLRTTNPMDPRRWPSTRTASAQTGRPVRCRGRRRAGRDAGLANRGCGNGIALTNQVTPLITALLPPFLRTEIDTFVYGGSEAPSPPRPAHCRSSSRLRATVLPALAVPAAARQPADG